ncbi:MAG TPA: DUF4214 domain-containing protein, partial [Iamia sp.]
MTLAALVVGTCSTAALATGPVAAQTTADPVAPQSRVVYGKGSMDTSHVDLTGPSSASAADPAAGTSGWSTTVDLEPGTEMVAITWDAATSAPEGEVALRSRTAAGWTAWTHIHAHADEGDEGAPGERAGTDVVWLGQEGADALEVRVEAGPLVDVKLMRMRYREGQARTVTEAPQSRTATQAVTKPTIRPRSDWASGGWKYTTPGCSGGPQVASSLKHAVVHHTAGGNSYSAAQVPGIIDGIYAFHTGSTSSGGRGWCDIAYNFLVDKYGGIWQGRTGDITKPVVGGHAQGFNTGSVGLNLIGNFETAQPTSAMLDSAAKFLAWKLSLHGLDPKGNVVITSGGNPRYTAGTNVTLPVINYHGQSGYTECPGANVIAKMPALRDAVAWYMAGSDDPPDPPDPPDDPEIDFTPFDTAEDLVWRQYVDFRRDPGLYEDRKWWFTELKAGRTNRNALVSALVRSEYVQDETADPIRLYLTYFGRIPDSAGIRYWWSEMDRGLNLRTVSARFSGSPEFKETYGNLSDEAFVRLVYRNVLDREGTNADISYWVGQIRNGKDSRGGVMALFSKTEEYKDRSQTVVDVILIHEVMLGRAIGAQSHMEWV